MNTQLFKGELVRLSAYQGEADAQILTTWSRDSEFQRLLDDEPAQPWTVKKVKEDNEDLPKPNNFPFMIRTLADDRLIGFIGLFGVRGAHGEAWVGVGIGDRDYWGKGYGTDAMRVVLRFGFTELNLHRVSLMLFGYNERALRSYQKAGFVVEGRIRQSVVRNGRRWDDLSMGILRDEWAKTVNGRT